MTSCCAGSVPLQDVVDALPQPNGEHYIDRPRHRSNSTDSTGSSGETAKRQKFEEHRKAHYKMREALRRYVLLCRCKYAWDSLLLCMYQAFAVYFSQTALENAGLFKCAGCSVCLVGWMACHAFMTYACCMVMTCKVLCTTRKAFLTYADHSKNSKDPFNFRSMCWHLQSKCKS